jgi:hypothetical protein
MKNVAVEATALREAFLAAAASAMPTVQWRDGPNGTLLYPEESPALGSLTVSFTPNETTLRIGPSGLHAHFALDEIDIYPDFRDDGAPHEVGLPDPVRFLACKAVEFSQKLLADEFIVRQGAWAVSCLSLPTAQRPFFRVWRAVTPWVTESVWSRRL